MRITIENECGPVFATDTATTEKDTRDWKGFFEALANALAVIIPLFTTTSIAKRSHD
jgi:hypothetical protein